VPFQFIPTNVRKPDFVSMPCKTVELLAERCPVRIVERVSGLHHATILSRLVVVGEKCERLLENRIRHIPVADVQCDETWGFVWCKEKRKTSDNPKHGDAYCSVGIESKGD
jgi:hypothetical protein